MKKKHWHSQFIFSFLTLVIVLGSIVFLPHTVHALDPSDITKDPDPCISLNGAGDLVITATDKGIDAVPLATSVPTNSVAEDLQLTEIEKSVCATAKATIAVKNKTVGVDILGVPGLGTSWDAIGKSLMKVVMNKLTDSTVKWINSGFNGSPQFVTDPTSYFANIANGFAGSFINQVAGSNLCAPFKANIVVALQTYNATKNGIASPGTYNPQCTLTGIGHNLEDFYNDFSKGGGWDTWFAMTQNNNNNPYGAYLNATNQLDLGIEANVDVKTLEANWGNGFLSSVACPDGSPVTYSSANQPTCSTGTPVTTTPGSVIQTQLQGVLGQGVADLGLARSFDDVVSALINQLATKIFTGAGGLFSAASSNGYTSSGTGGTTGFGGTPVDTGPGSNPSSSVVCTADKTFALIGEAVTWTATAPQAASISFSYAWSGADVPSGSTGSTLLQQYTTEGTKSPVVTVTSVRSATDTQAASTETSTIPCGPAVTVAQYNPLKVTCSPSVTHVAVGVPVTWTAIITGGSGKFIRINWDGDQTVVPGGNNAFIFPPELPNPTIAQYVWSIFAGNGSGVYSGQKKDGNTIQSFTNNGDGSMTDTLQRIYFDDNHKLGTVGANITVEDADTQLPAVEKDCGTTLVDDF